MRVGVGWELVSDQLCQEGPPAERMRLGTPGPRVPAWMPDEGWVGHVYSHLLEPAKCEGVSQVFNSDCQTSARPCSLKENPLPPALPLPPVNASSHNMRNPPPGRAPPTSRGIPRRWPLEEAGRGQPRAPCYWLAQQGSTPSRPWPATGSPPFPPLCPGAWWPLTPAQASQECTLPVPAPLKLEDTGGQKGRAAPHHWGRGEETHP